MNHLTFKVLITQNARQKAIEICSHQTHSTRIKKSYLNSLAIYAVETYLNYLGFTTHGRESDSAEIGFQTLSDTADLQVENWGKLECRPVLTDAKVCEIPPEVWEERRGYVAVQFNAELSEATLLGFLPRTKTEQVPLEQFQSLASLLDALHQRELSSETEKKIPQKAPVRLQNWLSGVLETGWNTLEELLLPASDRAAFNFRSSSALLSRNTGPSKIARGKLIHLGRHNEQVALVVRLMQKLPTELDISVELMPSHSSYLPPDLSLIVLDENDRIAMQAQAGGSEGLEFQFSGEPGERFSVEVALGDFKMSEQFIV